MLNRDAVKLLGELAAELWRLSDRWRNDPAEAEAIAAVSALRRIAETVRDAISPRPRENPISTLTSANLDAIGLGLQQAAATATAPELTTALRDVGAKLRSDPSATQP